MTVPLLNCDHQRKTQTPKENIQSRQGQKGHKVIEFITTDVSVRDGGHYTPAVKAGNFYYFSGHLSTDPETGHPAAGGVRAEAKMALANLERSMKAAGLAKTDIVQCRVYLPDVALWGDFNAEYAAFFGTHKPTRTIVPTGPLYGGCQVEIEAVGYKE